MAVSELIFAGEKPWF